MLAIIKIYSYAKMQKHLFKVRSSLMKLIYLNLFKANNEVVESRTKPRKLRKFMGASFWNFGISIALQRKQQNGG